MIDYEQLTFAEEYLSGNALRKAINCGSDKIRQWVRQGLPFVAGPNRARLFLLSEVVAWVRENDPKYRFAAGIQDKLDRVVELVDG